MILMIKFLVGFGIDFEMIFCKLVIVVFFEGVVVDVICWVVDVEDFGVVVLFYFNLVGIDVKGFVVLFDG